MLTNRYIDKPLCNKASIAVGLFLLLFPWPVSAWNYATTQNETSQSVQLRLGAEFSKKWKNGLGLHFEEDLRFDLYESVDLQRATTQGGDSIYTNPANFDKSYTTLLLSYKHPQFKYLKVDAGYTLKLMNKSSTDVNKIMRHRVFFGLTGSYRYEQWSFSLRERVMTEIRMGDIDLHTATGCYEHNRADWYLRSKLEIAYHAMSKPVKPYIWCEIKNTLNANELQKYYASNDNSNAGRQYINRIRTSVGVVWKLNSQNSLNFYYRFNYGYDRDINVKPTKQTVHLTEERMYQHAIGITYNFDW